MEAYSSTIEIAEGLAREFSRHAAAHDATASFAFENSDRITSAGLGVLTMLHESRWCASSNVTGYADSRSGLHSRQPGQFSAAATNRFCNHRYRCGRPVHLNQRSHDEAGGSHAALV